MKVLRKLWILPLVCSLGCADGGPVGSGVSGATISGNVIEVEASSSAAATLSEPVVITIDEVPGVEDTTDAQGNFALTGDFVGEVTVRFTTARVSATHPVEVPEGSEVLLQDVSIRENMVKVLSAEVRKFLGRVAVVDCSQEVPGAAEILVDDRRPNVANQFLVRVSTDTVVVDRNANPLSCNQIVINSDIVVAGRLGRTDGRPDGTIAAIAIIINPPPPGHAQPVDQRRFRGTVAVVNCQSGFLQILDEDTRQSLLTLRPNSIVVNADQQPIACLDVAVGDRVEGRGFFKARTPERIEGVIVMTLLPPTPPA